MHKECERRPIRIGEFRRGKDYLSFVHASLESHWQDARKVRETNQKQKEGEGKMIQCEICGKMLETLGPNYQKKHKCLGDLLEEIILLLKEKGGD